MADEQAGTEQFGDGAAPQRRLVGSHGNSLTERINSVKIESMNIDAVKDFRARVAKHAALADPARLRIVDLLTLGDLSPTELQAELGMPSNLLSHHLRTLEDAGLATRRRSEADRRRSYIRLAAGALEGLVPGAEHGARRVLFVCTRNSATVPAGRRALAAGQRNPLDVGGNAPRGPHRPRRYRRRPPSRPGPRRPSPAHR